MGRQDARGYQRQAGGAAGGAVSCARPIRHSGRRLSAPRSAAAKTDRLCRRPPMSMPSCTRTSWMAFAMRVMPEQGEAYRRGLRGLDEAAQAQHKRAFVALAGEAQDDILRLAQEERCRAAPGGTCPPRCSSSIACCWTPSPPITPIRRPGARSGFGGPASPRGYVRMALNRRDPWEAAEAKPGAEESARRENTHVR